MSNDHFYQRLKELCDDFLVDHQRHTNIKELRKKHSSTDIPYEFADSVVNHLYWDLENTYDEIGSLIKLYELGEFDRIID